MFYGLCLPGLLARSTEILEQRAEIQKEANELPQAHIQITNIKYYIYKLK
jgi:hypothetical protein